MPYTDLRTEARERIAKARADQWMNVLEVCSVQNIEHIHAREKSRENVPAKMAQRDQEMAMAPARSPSGLDRA